MLTRWLYVAQRMEAILNLIVNLPITVVYALLIVGYAFDLVLNIHAWCTVRKQRRVSGSITRNTT